MNKLCKNDGEEFIYNSVLNLGRYNLIRPRFAKYLPCIPIDRQNTYRTADQILNYIARIPEIRIISNLIFPNWIINDWHDVGHGLVTLLQNPQFWILTKKYNWINACGIHIYRHENMNILELVIVEFLKWCNYLIITVPEFMTSTQFWEWLTSCKSITEELRTQIIFFTKAQARTYKTTAVGVIPIHIAKIQNEFYNINTKFLNMYLGPVTTYELINTRPIDFCLDLPDNNTGPPLQDVEKPLVIQELEKLKSELLAYNLVSPEELDLETGAIIEKINNIREFLGINY